MYIVIRQQQDQNWYHLGEGVGYIASERGKSEAKRYETQLEAQEVADRMNSKDAEHYQDHTVIKLRRG